MRRRLCCSAVVSLVLLTLPSCSSVMKVGISVDPPSAAVFVNGVRDGQGARRIHDFDFGEYERVCVQAAAPGFEPICEMLTKQQVTDQLAKYGDFTWVLKQEK
jgi:hypothetical protein